ncbi:efflux RND transporter permease subunit [uncultured Litoreibacter sp.]|uniref:efflux RND transporter permease subunit n=1 Tax=uncultured Litoreibacter sp. TaxID=1392394 RepID=UPI00261B4C34|nr:efflux RND transporter permease subunit [uncultured Litoreibacter sp.]
MRDAIKSTTGGVLSYFTRHRTAANLLLVILIAVGVAALPRMRTQFFPDVILDSVSVNIQWNGAGADDVDRAIVQLMEPALLGVEGVASSTSQSREGSASINLEFEPNWDMSRAADEVQAAVDAVNDLPDDAEDPVVRRGAWRDRVTDVVITGPVAVEQLGRFADEFVTRLFAAGVTRTSIRGVAAPETIVEVASTALIKNAITMAEIAEAIRGEASADPAGDVSGGNARVRTGIAKRDPSQIAAIVLRSNADGSNLTIGDVATIVVEGTDRDRAYFAGDNPAISIRVDRSNQGDAIKLQAQVTEVAEELALTLPSGTSIDLIRTRSEAITGRLDILVDNGAVGLGLVVLLLFLFLNVRTAIWVAAGIPVAMLGAIALMYVAGLTINMVSLFALIITLGIVVDDAIVVGEHADFRARQLGEDPVTASENAARRMSAPVFSATLTTIIAFFGLVAVGGRFGDLIADIPFTVIVVLIASLVECFLILPNHMSHALKERPTKGFSRLRLSIAALALSVVAMVLTALIGLGLLLGATALGWVDAEGGLYAAVFSANGIGALAGLGFFLLWFSFYMFSRPRRAELVLAMSRHGVDAVSSTVNVGFEWVRHRAFRPLMHLVIWARYPVLALVLVVLASQAALFIKGDVTWRFFNAPERGSVSGNFSMLPGATREDTIEMMREMQRATNALADDYQERYGTNPLDYVLAEVGGTTGRGLSGQESKDADQLGAIAIELIDADQRPYSSFQFVGELQDAVRRHPMVEQISFRGWRSGPGGDSLDVQLFGAEAQTLKSAAEAFKTAMLQFPEVSAVEDSLAYDKEELILDLTAQGQALGFTIDALGRVLRNRLNGIEAATYPDGPRSATIRVELPTGELTADFLDRTFMRAPSGVYVPLADIVTVQSQTGFSTVRRENGIRLVSVTGDISEDDPARAAEIAGLIAEEILPQIEQDHGVSSRQSGLAEQEEEFLNDAMLGMILCLIGIYLALAWVFASFTRPIVIMAIIPFGLIGTIYGHHAWDVPLSMFTVVGLIGMTGIIINDSIVLVSTIDEYAEERGLIPAIVDGAVDRLRPVLLTTLTTVLGLAPLLFESSRHAQFLKPTVITLCYGLGFGMLLVLLVVPSLIAMQSDVARQTKALRRAMSASRAAPIFRGIMLANVLVAAVLFAVTLGATIWTGAMPGPLHGLVPASAMSSAFAMFMAGVLALLVVNWIGASITQLVGRKAKA